MKKLIKICCFAVLLLMVMTGVSAAEKYTAAEMYTISYDENRFILDNESFTEDSTDNYHWLFILSDDETVIDASYEMVEEYKNLTLYNADSKTLSEYQQDMLDSFSDRDPVFVAVRKVGVNQIPFYIFRMEDEQGSYYMAETVVKGCAIDFLSYSKEDSQVNENNYMTLCDLLDTFEPVLNQKAEDTNPEKC